MRLPVVLFVASSSLLWTLAAGCPPPAAEGEGEGAAAGEGEGEGAAGGEGEGAGEGEGEGEGGPAGTLLVPGAGLNLEDVAKDGSELAYRDGGNVLFTANIDNGTTTQVVVGTDKAVYHGNYLVALHGLDVGGKFYASADVVHGAGGTLAALGVRVRTKSLDASFDGETLYFESQDAVVGGVEALHLLGAAGDTVLFAGQNASKEKARFTPDGAFLVVGANIPLAGGGSNKVVSSFDAATATEHPIVTDVDSPSNETATTRDGTQVIMGLDESGDKVRLAIHNTDGSGSTLNLHVADAVNGVPPADGAHYKMTEDDVEVVYLFDTTAVGGGAIHAVHRDGTLDRQIRAAGGHDLVSISSTHLVFGGAVVDPNLGLEELHIVGLDGSTDTLLGANAVDEGFSSDGNFYLFRDGVGNGLGTFKVWSKADNSVTTIADGVKKVSKASATRAVFLDSLGVLRSLVLGGDVTILSDSVDHFGTVPDSLRGDSSQVAFSRTDGIYVAAIP